MDQTQQKALNALEPYVLLSKSATSPRAATDLITQVTSTPNTYVFAELLQAPNIQSLRTASSDYAPYFILLEIFSWGTWSEYTSTPNLPLLSDAQSLKLRQLSLLSLSTSHTTLTYSHLLGALSLPDIRALEDLIISSIYAGLLDAKLDTQSKCVDVSCVSPLRDLKPNSVPRMIAVFNDWNDRCTKVLLDLECQVAGVRRKAIERRRSEQEHEKAIDKAFDKAPGDDRGMKVGFKRGVGEADNELGYADDVEVMDLDDTLGRGGQRNAKRGGKFGGIARRII